MLLIIDPPFCWEMHVLGKHVCPNLQVHNTLQENTEPSRNSGALLVGSLHNMNFLILLFSLSFVSTVAFW